MAAEFFRDLLRRLPFENIPNTQRLFGDRSGRIPPLEAHVDRLIGEASTAEVYGKHELARQISIEAAVAARAVYEGIPVQGNTAYDRLSRARHAEAAVTRFIIGGAIEDAKLFGESVLLDPTLPAVTTSRIRQELEELGK